MKEMTKCKIILLNRQSKEKSMVIDYANKRMSVVRKNRAGVEDPYRKRVDAIQRQIDQLKSIRSVNLMRPQTSMRATQTMIQVNRKSMVPKLAIKPLGVALTKEKKQIMMNRSQLSVRN